MNAQAMMNKIKAGQLDDAFRRVYVTDGEVAKQKSENLNFFKNIYNIIDCIPIYVI